MIRTSFVCTVFPLTTREVSGSANDPKGDPEQFNEWRSIRVLLLHKQSLVDFERNEKTQIRAQTVVFAPISAV